MEILSCCHYHTGTVLLNCRVTDRDSHLSLSYLRSVSSINIVTFLKNLPSKYILTFSQHENMNKHHHLSSKCPR